MKLCLRRETWGTRSCGKRRELPAGWLLRRGLGSSALVVEREQTGEDFLGGEGPAVDFGGPVVGGDDGLVEGAVDVGEPGGALVVEVGEGALLELGLRGVGRVEPVVAELDEVAGGGGDGLDEGRVGFGGFRAGWPGEWEGVEGRVWCVTGTILELSSHIQRPELVGARRENTEEVVVFAGDYVDQILRDYALLLPNVDPMFGHHGGCDETPQRRECQSHGRTGLAEYPPVVGIGLSTISHPSWANAMAQVLERHFIE